jgi:sulfur carrier protein
MLKVSLNDELVEVPPNTSLGEALPAWTGADGAAPAVRYVVAVNREFVPRSDYTNVILQDGDEIDLVRPVWGG